MTDSELADLEAKALAATPGPFYSQVDKFGVFTKAGQDFAEAATPGAVLALIADVRRLRGLLGRAQDFGFEHSPRCPLRRHQEEGCALACVCGLEALEAEIARELEGTA